jgi:hypothetical protein
MKKDNIKTDLTKEQQHVLRKRQTQGSEQMWPLVETARNIGGIS